MPDPQHGPPIAPFLRKSASAFGRPVCRLGLASRGGSGLRPEDVHHALGRGVDFLNWPGTEDALSRAVAELGRGRERVVACAQFEARSAADAAEELRTMLAALGTDYVDVLTFYYVEELTEWAELCGPGGALDYCRAARRDGVVRRLRLPTRQRGLAAAAARSGHPDALMIRYNAAHRGAEREVFPVTDALGLPVIAYTALRWGGAPAADAGGPARLRRAAGPGVVSLRPAGPRGGRGVDGPERPGRTGGGP